MVESLRYVLQSLCIYSNTTQPTHGGRARPDRVIITGRHHTLYDIREDLGAVPRSQIPNTEGVDYTLGFIRVVYLERSVPYQDADCGEL